MILNKSAHASSTCKSNACQYLMSQLRPFHSIATWLGSKIFVQQCRWFILPSALFSLGYGVCSTLCSHMSALSSDCRAQARGNIQAHRPPICLLSAGQGSVCTGNWFLIGWRYSTLSPIGLYLQRGLEKVWFETSRKLVTVGLSFKGRRGGLRWRSGNNDPAERFH